MRSERTRRTGTLGFLSGLPGPRKAPQSTNGTPDEHFGVHRTSDDLLLRFNDPSSPKGIHELSLASWLEFEDLGLAIADYMYEWGKTAGSGTRESRKQSLYEFRLYLKHTAAVRRSQTIRLRDLSSDLINGYVDWLDHPMSRMDPNENAPGPWSENTRNARWSAARLFIEWLVANPRYSHLLAGPLKLTENPWPGRHHKTREVSSLDESVLKAIRLACKSEIETLIKHLEYGESVILDPTIVVPPPGERSTTPFRNLETRIKAVHHLYPSGLPSRSVLQKANLGLSRALTPPYDTVDGVCRYLHFTPRSIVPIVLLLAMDSFFNPSTILTLDWSNIRKNHPIFGGSRWLLVGEKPRAKSRGKTRRRSGGADKGEQRHSIPALISDPFAAANLLRLLERHTEKIRPYLPLVFQTRVFVYWQIASHGFRSFYSNDGASSDRAWVHNLKLFIDDHNLPSFVLKQMRQAGADIVFAITDGDLKAQQKALGHSSAATTYRHYQSTYAKAKRQESLAAGMQHLDRFVASEGKVDIRRTGMTERKTAATPGFTCFEPEHSPQPGQQPGRLCSAYGSCPDCPLSSINPHNPRTYVRLAQLRIRFHEARVRLDPLRWAAVWQKQLLALDEVWLPKFSDNIIREAGSISLPPIPEIE